MQSFQLLNETIINTNNEIKNKIGSDNFANTIDTFAKTISELSKTTKDFVQENNKSIVSITEVVTTLNKLQNITETCIGKFEQVDKKYQEITISTSSLNQVTIDLVEEYKIALPKTEQLSLVMGGAVETISKLNASIETSRASFASGFGDTSELLSFKQSLSKVSEELRKLESLVIRINNFKN
jgi:methyl-accepting chemotaxis protein